MHSVAIGINQISWNGSRRDGERESIPEEELQIVPSASLLQTYRFTERRVAGKPALEPGKGLRSARWLMAAEKFTW